MIPLNILIFAIHLIKSDLTEEKAIGTVTLKNESDSYAEEDFKPYNVKVIECAGTFFSFGKCPETKRVYTIFDAIYTQLIPIPVARKKKSIKCVDECDKTDVIYLIDVYQGLLKSVLDEHLAKWFLRLYLEFLKKKLRRREIQNELFFNTHRMFDCDEYKLRQEDFVDILTNTTCKRKLLFEFLRLLGREVKKSLQMCATIEATAEMESENSWCLTGCGTGKRNKHLFTNYELYLRVIEFFVKRLKKCIITRAQSTLCNTDLTCTYILALPVSQTLVVGGIPLLINLYISAGTSNSDPECNTGFNQPTTNGGLIPPIINPLSEKDKEVPDDGEDEGEEEGTENEDEVPEEPVVPSIVGKNGNGDEPKKNGNGDKPKKNGNGDEPKKNGNGDKPKKNGDGNGDTPKKNGNGGDPKKEGDEPTKKPEPVKEDEADKDSNEASDEQKS